MLATLKTTDVRSRIEPEIKNRATEVLASYGLNLSDAIRLFLRQVVAQARFAIRNKSSQYKNACSYAGSTSYENSEV